MASQPGHPFAGQQQDAMHDVDTTPFQDPFTDDSSLENAPPPPYESLCMNDGAPVPPKSLFAITVTDPVKHGEGVGAYISYKVTTKTDHENYKSKHCEVIRRYRDFAWLHARLQEQNRGIIVPPVPEKNVVQKYQNSPEFLEVRRRALTSFINRVAAHPALAGSRELGVFLEAGEEEWAAQVARAKWESGDSSAKKKLASTIQLFKDLGHSTSNLLSGKTDDEEEDPEYLKVRDYMWQLEAHLAEAHRQAHRLIRRQADLGSSLADFGSAMLGLGKFEAGDLADAFVATADRATVLAKSAQEQAGHLSSTFEAALKDFVRLVRSCKGVMGDRGHALAALQAARSDLDSRRTKLAKLRGTPGIKEERVAETEREVAEAGARVETARAAYETIVRRMSAELSRFQKERGAELAAALRGLAASQAGAAAEAARAWRSLLPSGPVTSNGAAH